MSKLQVIVILTLLFVGTGLIVYERDMELQRLRANVKELEQRIVVDPDSGQLFDGKVRNQVFDDHQKELQKRLDEPVSEWKQ